MTTTTETPSTLLKLQQVKFSYQRSDPRSGGDNGGNFQLHLRDFNVLAGESIAITGPSGFGKTTLLLLIAGILLPAQGVITIERSMLNQQSDRWRRRFRAQRIGMVFQSFELLEYLSVLENILLPLRLTGSQPITEFRSRAMILAERTGIEHKLRARPAQLSQGERQRVAVCRALICNPPLILADEPTGNLDPGSKQRVVDLLLQQCADAGSALLMVTHDTSLTSRFDRTCAFGDLLEQRGAQA